MTRVVTLLVSCQLFRAAAWRFRGEIDGPLPSREAYDVSYSIAEMLHKYRCERCTAKVRAAEDRCRRRRK